MIQTIVLYELRLIVVQSRRINMVVLKLFEVVGKRKNEELNKQSLTKYTQINLPSTIEKLPISN